MNKITFLVLLILSSISFGCSVQRQSKFTSSHIKPYKESSSTDDNQTLRESLHYKEHLFLGRWYEINSILHFENSVFKSLEQGKEELLNKDMEVIVR